MTLIDHTFSAELHEYTALKPVLNASSIIALNGLSEKGAIPLSVLQRASERGTGFDAAAQAYLEGKNLPELSEEVEGCFRGFLGWCSRHDIEIAYPLQKSLVWEFEPDCPYFIGCIPDLPVLVDGVFTIVETKTTHPLSGVAEQMKHLAWRLQLEIQLQGFLHLELGLPKKLLLHCHSKLKEQRRKSRDGHEYGEGFEAIPFNSNDANLYDSAIRMAVYKLEHQFKIEDK